MTMSREKDYRRQSHSYEWHLKVISATANLSGSNILKTTAKLH